MPSTKPEPDSNIQEPSQEGAGSEPSELESVAEAMSGESPATEETESTDTEAESSADERIAALEVEVSELKDQLLRALAEAENVRRRAQRERADATKYAAAPMLRDLLAVADNLSRAIESVPEGGDADDERLQTLLDGVKLTDKELNAVFERHHIVKLEPLGEQLDPHRHEALYELPNPDHPNGTVVQIIQPGYLLHDRLLRPARVGVAKGAPPVAPGQDKPATTESEANGESSEPGAHIDTSA